MTVDSRNPTPWPALPLSGWQDTQETLHLWMQIVGKVKLELTPFLNEWWNVAFALTPRGMTTGLIPSDAGAFAIDFDFIDHTLFVYASDGRTRSLPLASRSVATFYEELLATLHAMGIAVVINPLPVELPDPISSEIDHTHATYDPGAAHRFWEILVRVEPVLQQFRSPFVGKSSPVNFFWGSFDLSATRFSGRSTSPPEGAPYFLQLAESQENFACGFWPGNSTMSGVTFGEPAFYAYIYPEPAGFNDAILRAELARYDPRFGQFLLRYDDARDTGSLERTVLDFFASAYEAAATLGGWDRAVLERLPLRGK